MDYRKTIASKLLQIKAIIINLQNPFTWTSGIISPIYCDNRIALSHPEVRELIQCAFLEKARSLRDEVNCIAAVATAGIPWGAVLSYQLGLPFVYVRDKPKAHGRQNQIEGHLPLNGKVLLIEDLISTGKSSIAAATALRDQGAEVAKIQSIFTYGMSFAVKQFEFMDLTYESLSDYSTLLQVALETGYIRQEELEALKTWKDNPEAFGK